MSRYGLCRALNALQKCMVRHFWLLHERAQLDLRLSPCNPMFYDLLIPLDGTTQADSVVQLAARAAIAGQSRLHVMCVVDPAYLTAPQDIQGTEPDGLAYPRANEESQRARHVVTIAVDALRNEGFDVTGYLCGGDPFDAIVKNAARLRADLIVMGHRHLSRLQRLSNPSTTGKVLERSPCPVLIDVEATDSPSNS